MIVVVVAVVLVMAVSVNGMFRDGMGRWDGERKRFGGGASEGGLGSLPAVPTGAICT